MPNPFYTAQADAAQDPMDPGYAEGVPQFPAGSMQPGMIAPTPDAAVQAPDFAGGDEIGAIRDSLMAQFPDLMAPDEPPLELDTTQKLTLFGLFLANPKGAADMIRERRERAAKRAAMRAQIALRMTGVAGEILKAQNESERAILEARLAVNRDFRERKEAEMREHIERSKLALQQSEFGLRARQYADAQQFNKDFMGGPQAPSPGGILADSTPNPLTGEVGGQTLSPDAVSAIQNLPPDQAPIDANAPAAGGRFAGMRRSVTMSRNGPQVTYTDPTPRDPAVDFDSWVRARFPRGVPSRIDQQTLVQMWQNERRLIGGGLQPGSFGAAAQPLGGGYPDLFRPQETEPGYDDLSGDVDQPY